MNEGIVLFLRWSLSIRNRVLSVWFCLIVPDTLAEPRKWACFTKKWRLPGAIFTSLAGCVPGFHGRYAHADPVDVAVDGQPLSPLRAVGASERAAGWTQGLAGLLQGIDQRQQLVFMTNFCAKLQGAGENRRAVGFRIASHAQGPFRADLIAELLRLEVDAHGLQALLPGHAVDWSLEAGLLEVQIVGQGVPGQAVGFLLLVKSVFRFDQAHCGAAGGLPSGGE